MAMNNLHDLFVNRIEELQDAELQLVDALPTMIQAASSEKLQLGLVAHLEQTKAQANRLAAILDMVTPGTHGLSTMPNARVGTGSEDVAYSPSGEMAPAKAMTRPNDKVCEGMAGLIAEGQKLLRQTAPAALMDAGIIGAGQRIELYEIAAYSEARALANLLGYIDVERLLVQSLEEERLASFTLNEAAVNAVYVMVRSEGLDGGPGGDALEMHKNVRAKADELSVRTP